MLDFNSYISNLFGRRSASGETRKRLEGVLDTLTKQLSLLAPKNPQKPAFKTFSGQEVVVDISAITRGDSLLEGEEFNAGMDKLTGQCLVKAVARKEFGNDFNRLGSNAAKSLFGAEVAQLASSKVANQWKGFGKCVAKAMQVSDAQDRVATEEITSAVRENDLLGGAAKAYANWRQGGKAGQALGLTNDLMQEIRESMIPKEKESLVEATKRTVAWLAERLQKPEGSEGAEGQDGQSEGQAGAEGQDGQSEGQDGQDDAKETKSAADLLREAANNPPKAKARGVKTGSFNPLEYIENRRTIDGVPLANIEAPIEYKIQQRHSDIAVRAGLATPTKWHSAGEFLIRNAKGFPPHSRPTMAKAELAYKVTIANEKRAISQVADSISFPNRDTALPEYGLRSGDIDEGNLWSLAAGISHRVFARSEIISKPKALVVLLLDLSASMGGKNKIIEASQIVRLIIEAWQNLRLDGAELCVYGHTAELDGNSLDMVRIFDRTHDGRAILCDEIEKSAMNQNLDGYAVHAALVEAWKVNPDIKPSETTLIVVSDGEPMASCLGYSDTSYGIAHTAHAVSTHRKAGVHIEGIGICNAYAKDVGEAMFGKGNCVILNDTLSGLPLLTKRIKKICDR